MSLTEVLEAIRILSPKEQVKVRELLDNLNVDSRVERFERLRGSIKVDRFDSLSLEDFKAERREMWKGLSE
ncbi:MAG: hypothetical protein ACT4O9_16450 [Blastocatellia bacterium]